MTVAHYVQSFFTEKRNSLDSFDTTVEFDDDSLPSKESHGRSTSSVWFDWWTFHRRRGSRLFSNRCVCSKSDSSSIVAPSTIKNHPNPNTLFCHLIALVVDLAFWIENDCSSRLTTVKTDMISAWYKILTDSLINDRERKVGNADQMLFVHFTRSNTSSEVTGDQINHRHCQFISSFLPDYGRISQEIVLHWRMAAVGWSSPWWPGEIRTASLKCSMGLSQKMILTRVRCLHWNVREDFSSLGQSDGVDDFCSGLVGLHYRMDTDRFRLINTREKKRKWSSKTTVLYRHANR